MQERSFCIATVVSVIEPPAFIYFSYTQIRIIISFFHTNFAGKTCLIEAPRNASGIFYRAKVVWKNEKLIQTWVNKKINKRRGFYYRKLVKAKVPLKIAYIAGLADGNIPEKAYYIFHTN